MIYTITCNPSLDYIVKVDELKTHSVNRLTEEWIIPGGKGINVSCVLQNLGVESIALGFIAGFTGERLVQLLHEKNISCHFIPVSEGMTRINVKIHHEYGEETEINGQGPTVTAEDVAVLLAYLDQLTEEDILVLSGSVPKGMTYLYEEILGLCSLKAVKCVVDASGTLLLSSLSYHPFLIKPNVHELQEIFQKENVDTDTAIALAQKLQDMGARNVLVSMGEAGGFLLSEKGKVYMQNAPKGTVQNAVGAGDSMVAGFLAGYMEKTDDYMHALNLGISAGSASAFSKELATGRAIMELYDKITSE